ncbi:MAG: SGNH/GDSL hydrolase family protein [Hyphomicrobiaceae bacterium]
MRIVAALLGALAMAGAVGTHAEAEPTAAVGSSPLSKVCSDAGAANPAQATLPFTAKALRERKRIKVLAVGATPLNQRDQAHGQYALVEQVLETTFKGLDVEIIDRGVSGELARDGAERIRNEVAMVAPDLVLWQVGVADALALTPPAELKATLTGTVGWLKAHDVDVILIGLRYQRSLSKNAGFQQIRQSIREVVREQAILRIGHYESMEAIDRIRAQEGAPVSELDLTDAGSICIADFLSRALAVGLFAKPRPEAAKAGAPVAPAPFGAAPSAGDGLPKPPPASIAK